MPVGPNYKANPAFRKQYQSAIGSLIYAMLGTRPDLAFAISIILWFSSNPTNAH